MSYSKNPGPCLGCKDRIGGCHATCEKYNAYKIALLDEKIAFFTEKYVNCGMYKDESYKRLIQLKKEKEDRLNGKY